MPEAEVAAVILNYNGRALLPATLAALQQQTRPVEVWVADNGSTDGSLELAGAEFPGVHCLSLGRNLGFAGGYNQALAHVRQPWLALVNNDAVLAPDWLEQALAYAGRHPRAAVVGGKLLLGQPAASAGRRLIQSAGARFTEAGTAFDRGLGQPDEGQWDTPGPVGSVAFAAVLVRRPIYQALNGMDAGYFFSLEDVDFCWRAWLAGHEVHYYPAAEAVHGYGTSGGGRLAPFRIRWMQRNRLANMAKHLQARSFPRAALVSLAYDLYRLVEFGRRGRADGLRALMAGTLAFWRALPALLAQRRQEQASRRLSDADLRRLSLMVPALDAFREYRRLSA